MRIDRKTVTAGVTAAGLLGVGLYLAVPAMADDPSTSPSPKTSESPAKQRPGLGEDRPFGGWGPGRPGRGGDGNGYGPPGARAGVHGEATVSKADGGFRVVTFQSGEITAVTSTTLTVKSADGTSWTWTAGDDVKVRKDREDAALKDLAQGDDVRVAGERSGDTRTAKLVRALD